MGERLPFDHIQMRFMRKMAEALFDGYREMAITHEQVVENVQHIFAMIGGTKAREISWSLRLCQLAMAPFFNELSIEARRERIEHRMRDTGFDAFQDMARIRGILYFAYYGHWEPGGEDENRNNPVLRQIGFTLPKFRNRNAPGELPIAMVEDRDLTHEHFTTVEDLPDDIDIVVVGSGSGGAVSAWNLARKGYRVVIVEAGPHYPSARISHEEARMASHLFKHGALQTTRDNDFVVFQGRNVGGSPTINNGICLRMKGDRLSHPDAHDPFQAWRALGAPIDEARFQQSYDAVEQYLGIGEIEHRSSRTNGPHLMRGWAALAAQSADPMEQRAKAGWFAKNYGPPHTDKACVYCGYCNTGCPYARKNGMAQSYLPDACRHNGVKIIAETKVERIRWARGTGGRDRAIGVEVIDEYGAEHFIPAKTGVVVAAGTIASSLLLDRSGIEGTGRGISMNVASPVIALMPEGQSPAWDEDQMATVVDCGEFLLESHFQPPMSMAAMMPGWFEEMDRRMRSYNRICSSGILFPADRCGRIRGGKLDFKIGAGEIDLVRKAMATLTRLHFAGGALEVWPALLKGQTLTPDMNIEEFFRHAIREADDVTLSSSHPHGGNPMCVDPEIGVVDTDCRVHGTQNVLVTDASVFPSCIRVNAQFTTMAMAHYATGFGDPFAGG
ncbi:GMC family oxidoreductase [Novosphingobium sp. ZN18A2]|uniref:GMC family oxidoreductase n=1 Tax=Novosphingobium sp. ZN18A2 TaxID=3079861 RepID=UPI0030CB8906